MKILVVEDDRSVAQALEMLLSECQYAVDVATDGEAGLEMAETFEYDLILLDVGLPKLDGVSLCQQLRSRKMQMPILLLTGQSEGRQKAIALNAGADDYVVKPFDCDELTARVQALLRRGTSGQPILSWGALSLDPSRRTVTYGTRLLFLTPKEYAILELLLRNPHTYFSSRAMLDHAWAATESPGEEAVRVHIKELRQKLAAVGAPKDLIKTVHRVGYQLNSLYSSAIAEQATQQATLPHVAELTAVNEELRVTLEQLRSTQAELNQKNQELESAYQTIEHERQELQKRVTERSQELIEVNRQLQQSDEKFRHFAENSHSVIWLAAPNSLDALYVSPSYATVWGRSCQSLIDQPQSWLEAVHPDDRDQVQAKLEQQRQGEKIEAEYRIIRPDGAIRWIRDLGFAIRNEAGEVYRYGGSAEDITERKQAEQKIIEQAALLDIASDAIFVRDLDHRILYWNQGAERLYGWRAEEALGQKANVLLHESEAQASEIQQIVLEQGEWNGELRKVTKAGKPLTIEGHWTLVRDEAGQPKSILSVNTDITEKKQLEAQFYHAQRLESLGTLASGIAHDLNNVLTPILAMTQLLRRYPIELEQRSQLLAALEESAKRGANMVKQILTFVRGSEGQHIPVQIRDILQEVIAIVRQIFPRSIEIQQDISDPTVEMVSADPTQLHQVLMNLCVNARDAMPDGGVLSVTIRNSSIDERSAQLNLDAQAGQYVVIAVTDTGMGILPEIRDRIFDPFFTTKAAGQNSGLGLSTVLGIVRSHHGFVQVSSEVGQGTQFRVYLPMMQGAGSDRREMAALDGHGELILIVDDDLAVRSTNQALLESHHYQTLAARDGVEAIELYTQHRDQIQAILLDVMMPNLDGISTVRTLSRLNPAVKIIALSGLVSNQDAILAAGASAFLAKPYSILELLKVVHDLINA